MKKIIIIIRLDGYVNTKKALLNLNVVSMNTQVVQGRGNESVPFTVNNEGQNESLYMVDPLIPKRLIEIVADDKKVDSIVNAVISANRTGNSGDGKIFVIPVDDVLTIRTGEHEL